MLDIGCGWGGLILHAAQKHGVEAVGITLSQRQKDYADELIRQAGLADRCRVELRDYRQVDEEEGFDRLVSVGMAEQATDRMGEQQVQQERTAQLWHLTKTDPDPRVRRRAQAVLLVEEQKRADARQRRAAVPHVRLAGPRLAGTLCPCGAGGAG